MNYTITHIADQLKAERGARGLSQLTLSKLAGIPQSHISKIENGTVDLRLSSLIELARVLGLELTLVPRKALLAVKSIVRGSARPSKKIPSNIPSTIKELKRIQNTITSFTKDHPSTKEFAQIQRQINDIQHFRVSNSDLEAIQKASKTLQAIKFDNSYIESVRKILSEFQNVRNALAHSSIDLPAIETVRSAYALESDDNG